MGDFGAKPPKCPRFRHQTGEEYSSAISPRSTLHIVDLGTRGKGNLVDQASGFRTASKFGNALHFPSKAPARICKSALKWRRSGSTHAHVANQMLVIGLFCIAMAALLLLMSRPAPVYAAAGEFRRELYKFRSHAEAARRALLTPKQRAYEDWSLAWYENNKNRYEDREAELDAFEAASTIWDETH
jgi:hypothetical protein